MIQYQDDVKPKAEEVSRVFELSGIRRPYQDLNRIQRMIDNADIIISAWDGDKLVGIARALTDYSYCCYLSDLAVDKEYQRNGIGKKMIEMVRSRIGEEAALILIAAPEAVGYYPKIGFEHTDKCFIIPRAR